MLGAPGIATRSTLTTSSKELLVATPNSTYVAFIPCALCHRLLSLLFCVGPFDFRPFFPIFLAQIPPHVQHRKCFVEVFQYMSNSCRRVDFRFPKYGVDFFLVVDVFLS